jgi:uncharacterized protein (TIGR00730 family)
LKGDCVSNNRPELDPISDAAATAPEPVLEPRAQRRIDTPEVQAAIDRLVQETGGEPGSFKAKLVHDLVESALKLIGDGRDTGDLKLVTAAVKELRYAFNVFGRYAEPHKVTIFGSARTPKDHPDYLAAVEFSRLMARLGWMVITGAGGGIMEAGHVGPGRERSFGVAIRLPFEQQTNEVITGDSKLIMFRYFFTRKLMFIKEAEAVALFPGGFGTMDEAFELLTLVQTGKASMVPIVLCEGAGQTFWEEWDEMVRSTLLTRGWISPEDTSLYRICRQPEEAVRVIENFYRLYHSSRYVRDDLVIRLKKPISSADLDRLNGEFGKLVASGKMVLRGPFEVEEDHLDLPRLVFTHTRRDFGLLRTFIDRLNACEPV